MEKQIAIYGAGNYGKVFFEILKDEKNEILFFIDEFSLKNEFCGKPILRADEVKDKNIKIFISVTTKSEVVENFLISNKFTNIVTLTKTFEVFPDILKRLLITSNMWYKENCQLIDIDKINMTRELLSDDISQSLLDKIITFRKSLDPEDYIHPQSIDEQYFPSDLSLYNNLESVKFLDCGAFNGDTIKRAMNYFYSQRKNVDYIASIEPDLKNIEKIYNEQIKQKYLYPNTNFFTFPVAVWSDNEILKFDGSGTSGSISNQGINIPAIKLDFSFASSDVNFIKMDIEGAEKEAILGAEKIIKTNMPILAICIYHKPNDLWEIPLLINKLNPNYNMYIRVYGHLGLETVLYCIPK